MFKAAYSQKLTCHFWRNTRGVIKHARENRKVSSRAACYPTLHVLPSQFSVRVTRAFTTWRIACDQAYMAQKTGGVSSFKLPRIASLNREHREDDRVRQS